MTTKLQQLLDQKQHLERQIATEREAEQARGNSSPEEQQLATLLHSVRCSANHTDACGWEYENWNGATHQKYLTLARKVATAAPSIKIAISVVESMK